MCERKTRRADAAWRGRASPRDSLITRVYRFVRALIVGGGATLVDFSVFTACMHLLGLAPVTARLPALIAGATTQFIGNRGFTFRAQAGHLPRQVRWFLIAEAITLSLNWTTFRFLVPRLPGLAPELVGFVGTFVVFVGFAYPARRLVVFRLPSGSRPPGGGASPPG